MIKTFESSMNRLEAVAERKITSFYWGGVAYVCRGIAGTYLRKERVAMRRKDMVASVNHRMAYAVWVARTQQAERRARHAQ